VRAQASELVATQAGGRRFAHQVQNDTGESAAAAETAWLPVGDCSKGVGG
jgi:hypothetical protein